MALSEYSEMFEERQTVRGMFEFFLIYAVFCSYLYRYNRIIVPKKSEYRKGAP